MRTSTYEIILPLIGTDDREIDGKALLFNGLYSALDVVDRETADILRSGDVSALPFALRERLTQRGHITRRDEAGEAADARLLGRIWNRLVGFSATGPVLLPTYNCNFRCPYCFERHRLCRGKEWLSQVMAPETIDAVFAALRNRRRQGYRVESCTLYGGEPLLKENMATVRNICEHAREMGLTLTAITNGYDLDAYIGLLEEFRFKRLQITVDGVGEMNDKRRLHRDGVPTYDRILQNVALALDHGIDISLRVNVNGSNIGGIRALMDDLAARGLRMTRWEERKAIGQAEREQGEKKKGLFSYYFKAVSEETDSPTRVTEQQVLSALLEAGVPPMDAIEMQSQYSMPLQTLLGAMSKESFPYFSPAFCGSEQGMLGIGPDGLLYACWDLVSMEEESVGCTETESGRFLYNFEKAKWRTRTSDLMEPCRICPYIFVCRGGCAAEAKRAHGSYFREYCGESKHSH